MAINNEKLGVVVWLLVGILMAAGSFCGSGGFIGGAFGQGGLGGGGGGGGGGGVQPRRKCMSALVKLTLEVTRNCSRDLEFIIKVGRTKLSGRCSEKELERASESGGIDFIRGNLGKAECEHLASRQAQVEKTFATINKHLALSHQASDAGFLGFEGCEEATNRFFQLLSQNCQLRAGLELQIVGVGVRALVRDCSEDARKNISDNLGFASLDFFSQDFGGGVVRTGAEFGNLIAKCGVADIQVIHSNFVELVDEEVKLQEEIKRRPPQVQKRRGCRFGFVGTGLDHGVRPTCN